MLVLTIYPFLAPLYYLYIYSCVIKFLYLLSLVSNKTLRHWLVLRPNKHFKRLFSLPIDAALKSAHVRFRMPSHDLDPTSVSENLESRLERRSTTASCVSAAIYIE